MATGVITLAVLTVALAGLLLLSDRLLPGDADTAVDRIEKVLPRIHCGQCGYSGCRPYAEALVDGTAAINLCPPGGAATVQALANLLGTEPLAVAATQGHASLDQIAVIDEALCIGCNLCSRVCPVDAIIGIPQMMHTIIAAHCTGCELCLPPCPVDCIRLEQRHD
jgi:electron transport complex protein RnfB